jgi:hypothetical protein
MPSHLVMQAREKHPVQQVSEAGLGARVGAIEGKLPLFPAKPDHGAPFLHHRVFFGHEHWKSSIHMTASTNASAGSPPKPANAPRNNFSEGLCHVRPTPSLCAKPSPALKRSK